MGYGPRATGHGLLTTGHGPSQHSLESRRARPNLADVWWPSWYIHVAVWCTEYLDAQGASGREEDEGIAWHKLL